MDHGWVRNEFFWDGVFDELLTRLAASGSTTVGGLCSSAVSFAAASVHRLAGPTVLVVPGISLAENLRDDLEGILGRAYYFPPYETLPFAGEPAHPGVVADRIECMAALKSGERCMVVAPAASLVKKVPPPGDFSCMELGKGMTIPMEELEEWLTAAGYRREEGVWEQARWARRGGIIDIGSYGLENPVRLEFFGDTLESIRFFDQVSQRSIGEVKRCRILPAREALLFPEHWNRAMEAVPEDSPLSEKLWTTTDFPGIEYYLPVFTDKCAGILDYVGSDGTVLLLEPDAVRDALRETVSYYRENYDPAGVPFPFHDLVFREEELGRMLEERRTVKFVSFPGESVDVYYETVPQVGFTGHVEEMLRSFRHDLDRGMRIAVQCDTGAEEETFLDMIPGNMRLETGVLSLHEGFRMPGKGLAVLVERMLLSGRRRPERKRRYRGGEGLSDVTEISPGDIVVHRNHGIGRFEGLEKVETSGAVLDCLVIRYRDGDRLLVPIHEIGTVQKFQAPEGSQPKLDRIGGEAWDNRLATARKKAREIAGRLAALYARRRVAGRPPLPPPGHGFRVLSESFPYEETPDQLKTIESVMKDFESEHPMDRLVCGDVGFGKTEVAIRAAYRVVEAGFQAAVLVPTTVLAEQHYNTFRDRLAEFPVVVEMLSRFRTGSERRKILKRLALGEVDVIIGTHGLLGSEVRFHRLGLLVVDEEHRFGVAHKERLRELRADVDTLTMTATPIPRTLHMALSGFRDISLITTPPRDRYPVHTELVPFDAGIISRAVKRELERDGQVFFVHNRIASIGDMKEKLDSMLPGVRTVTAHGRMGAKQLEEVMHDFMLGRYDVLLCTSIIESGLDLPRVNTIIIDQAHTFGLADLYQLRGRVGRSHHQAYCCLVVRQGTELTPEARSRLSAIRRFTELGSGWNVAMRDLEVRGAGELLGSSQHGQITSIGYSMFEELIREEAAALGGSGSAPEKEVRVEIPGDSFIPPWYIPDVTERVRVYRCIWTAGSEDILDDWRSYLEDRYGEPPEPVKNVVERARVALLARGAGAEEVVAAGGKCRFVFPAENVVRGRLPRNPGMTVEIEKTGRVMLRVDFAGLEPEGRVAGILNVLRLLGESAGNGN